MILLPGMVVSVQTVPHAGQQHPVMTGQVRQTMMN
jgi:hypothetical protein